MRRMIAIVLWLAPTLAWCEIALRCDAYSVAIEPGEPLVVRATVMNSGDHAKRVRWTSNKSFRFTASFIFEVADITGEIVWRRHHSFSTGDGIGYWELYPEKLPLLEPSGAFSCLRIIAPTSSAGEALPIGSYTLHCTLFYGSTTDEFVACSIEFKVAGDANDAALELFNSQSARDFLMGMPVESMSAPDELLGFRESYQEHYLVPYIRAAELLAAIRKARIGVPIPATGPVVPRVSRLQEQVEEFTATFPDFPLNYELLLDSYTVPASEGADLTYLIPKVEKIVNEPAVNTELRVEAAGDLDKLIKSVQIEQLRQEYRSSEATPQERSAILKKLEQLR